jgi:hypothetical protein
MNIWVKMQIFLVLFLAGKIRFVTAFIVAEGVAKE